MPLVKLTEPGLRAAMRDPRYWGSYQPEQKSYRDWVTRGWHTLAQAEARGGGTVHVRAYTRVQNGRPEQVPAHTQMRSGAGDGTILLVDKPTGGGEQKLPWRSFARKWGEGVWVRSRALLRGSKTGYRPDFKTGTPIVDIEGPGLRDIIRRVHFD